jgi:hypothetical protein
VRKGRVRRAEEKGAKRVARFEVKHKKGDKEANLCTIEKMKKVETV